MFIAESSFLHTKRHFRRTLSKLLMAEKKSEESASASDTILKVLAGEEGSLQGSTGCTTKTLTSVVRSTTSMTGNGHQTQYQVQTIQSTGRAASGEGEGERAPGQGHSVSLPEIRTSVEKQEGGTTISEAGPSGLPDSSRTWRSEPSFQTGTSIDVVVCKCACMSCDVVCIFER